MQTLTQTASGEIVENINGTLQCENKKENWLTIADWLLAQDDDFKADVLLRGKNILVEFSASVPTYYLESLLEAFEYQK